MNGLNAKSMTSNIKCAFIYSILKYWYKVCTFVKLLHYQDSATLRYRSQVSKMAGYLSSHFLKLLVLFWATKDSFHVNDNGELTLKYNNFMFNIAHIEKKEKVP